MAKLYRNFILEEGKSGFLFSEEDNETEYWSIKQAKDAEQWKEGDDIYYDTQYTEEFITDKMPINELLNIMVSLKTEDVKKLLEEDSWLREPFMMFLSNPLINLEFKEQWEENIEKIDEMGKSMSTTSTIAAAAYLCSRLKK